MGTFLKDTDWRSAMHMTINGLSMVFIIATFGQWALRFIGM